MKTLEFKIYLTRSQQGTIDDWLAVLKYPWNKGVELIKRFNAFNCYDKRFRASAPCCPIETYNHGSYREAFLSCPIKWELDDFEEGKAVVSVRTPCGIVPVRPHEGGKLVTNLTFFGIQPCFTHGRNQDKPWLTGIPSKFIDGTVQSLADAWQAFLAGQRKPPKFKGKSQRIDTLVHNNSKDIKIKGDRINIPKLGWVKAKGLSDRWPQNVPFCPLKICRKASGYYLQLTGEVEGDSSKVQIKPKVPSAGFDPGIAFVYSDDAGRQVKVPPYLEKGLERLKRLQRKAQRQWDANQGLQTSEIPGWHPPMVETPWQRKNWRKTQRKIAKLHEKIARRGRAFNHQQSTKIVRQFQEIYLEDYKLSEIIRKIEPVDSGLLVVSKNDELTTIYEKNGRKLNKETNRAALRNRVGQLWTMIEDKGGKRVVRVERAGTSNECPKCGHVEEKLLRTRTHRCKQCGYVAPRNVAAAQVIKKRGIAREISCTEGEETKKRRKRYGKKDSGNEQKE